MRANSRGESRRWRNSLHPPAIGQQRSGAGRLGFVLSSAERMARAKAMALSFAQTCMKWSRGASTSG